MRHRVVGWSPAMMAEARSLSAGIVCARQDKLQIRLATPMHAGAVHAIGAQLQLRQKSDIVLEMEEESRRLSRDTMLIDRNNNSRKRATTADPGSRKAN
jgi:hypothetical protein